MYFVGLASAEASKNQSHTSTHAILVTKTTLVLVVTTVLACVPGIGLILEHVNWLSAWTSMDLQCSIRTG